MRTIALMSVLALLALTAGCNGTSVSSYPVAYDTPVATMRTFIRAAHAAAVYAERDNASAYESHLRTAYTCLTEAYREELPFERFQAQEGWRRFLFVTTGPMAGITDMQYADPEQTRAVVEYDLSGRTRQQVLVKQPDGTWKMPSPEI